MALACRVAQTRGPAVAVSETKKYVRAAASMRNKVRATNEKQVQLWMGAEGLAERSELAVAMQLAPDLANTLQCSPCSPLGENFEYKPSPERLTQAVSSMAKTSRSCNVSSTLSDVSRMLSKPIMHDACHPPAIAKAKPAGKAKAKATAKALPCLQAQRCLHTPEGEKLWREHTSYGGD